MNKYFLCVLFLGFLGIKFSQAQNISTDQFKKGDIVDKKYAAFDLGEYQKGQDRAYFVKFIGNISNLQMICFSRELGATAVMNQEEIELFLLKDGKIIDKRHEMFGREKSPEFTILHDNFIQYIELKHKWFENEVGNMSYNSENDYIDGLRYIVKEEKIVSFTDLSKAELRIYRNLIFAKYGYIFKSEDLNTYFKATDWYKPNSEIKVDLVMNETDKELVSYMLKLESGKLVEKHSQDSTASLNKKTEIAWADDKQGYIVDPRDKKKYKIVKIGNQTWMAENLAFKPGAGNFWAYNNNQSNAVKYGYLYDWEIAKTICSQGWHLPSKEEFETLLQNLGGSGLNAYHPIVLNGNSGFSALLGGYRNYDVNFYYIGTYTGFWSSTGDYNSAWYLAIDNKYKYADMYFLSKSDGFYARCLLDNFVQEKK